MKTELTVKEFKANGILFKKWCKLVMSAPDDWIVINELLGPDRKPVIVKDDKEQKPKGQ
jgi:hypothetical protein